MAKSTTPTREALEQQLLEDKRQRESACLQAIQEVLVAHNCEMTTSVLAFPNETEHGTVFTYKALAQVRLKA